MGLIYFILIACQAINAKYNKYASKKVAARHLSDDFLTEYYKLNPRLGTPLHADH
jgi:hypothetical protein